MNRFQHHIQKIKEEMKRGQGGTDLYSYPIALEPLFETFGSSLKPQSFLGRLFLTESYRPVIQRSQTNPLSFIRIRPSSEDGGAVLMAVSWLSAMHVQTPAAFEVVGYCNRIFMQCVVHPEDVAGTIGIISANYPNAEVFETREDMLKKNIQSRPIHIQNYRLEQSHFFPLTMDVKKGDPYVSLFGTLSGLTPHEVGALQVLFVPAHHNWRSNILQASRSEYDPKQSPFYDLPDLPKLSVQKTEHPLFFCSIRLIGSSSPVIRRLETFFNRFAGVNRLIQGPEPYPIFSALDRTNHSTGVILNAEELSCLVHLPSPEAIPPVVEQARRTAPVPSIAQDRNGIIFGRNTHRGKHTPVAIGKEWLTRHVLALGATGSGKTVWQAGFFQQFIQDQGAIYIDPSGDSARAFLKLIPTGRADSVIYLDPTDPEYAPAFNILELSASGDPDLIRSSLLTAFRRLFGSEGMGPRSSWLLSHALATLLKSTYRPKTLVDLPRLFSDRSFRAIVTGSITVPEIHQFWKVEYPKLPESATLPLLNKLHGFLGHEKIRSMLCQHAKFDLETVIRNKKILVINLSKGELGESNAAALGFLILTAIQQMILGLSRVPPSERNYFTLILDEAHLFLGKENSETINSLLSESRKFKCVTVLGTQFIAQADRTVRDALLGNVGTLLCFRVGIDDAQLLQKELGPFTAEDLLNLIPGEALIRVGRAQDSFNLQTPFIDLETLPEGQKPWIISNSRKLYYTRRDLLRPENPISTQKSTEQEKSVHDSQSSTSSILPDEKKFLEYVMKNPSLSVTKLYREQRLSAYTGDRLKKTLLQKGLMRKVETHLGKGSRLTKFLYLTANGFEALDVQFSPDHGKGGPRHRYWVSVIKSHAEGKGYGALIEEPIPESQETVDIGLEKEGQRIAVEISITTSVEQEVGNISKCLGAGYDRIVVLCLKEDKVHELQNRAISDVPEHDRAKISVGLVYGFDGFF